MVPKLHRKGSSFKGAAAYLLHDKDSSATSERVAWTDAVNIALDDPQMAWRIMAATALDKERLKQAAGIKATGRKSDAPVLHLTLSWHPDEKASLSGEEMRSAAYGAIEALGAKDHQALIIAHNDEAHPHLHILLNRVNPHDGRMLSSSKEKLNLSRWAESYEQGRGRIFCEERVANNEARDRGNFRRGAKDQHRRLFEEVRSGLKLANDNRDMAEELRKRQREIDAALCEKGRRQASEHRAQWEAITEALKQRKNLERERSAKTKERMFALLAKAHEQEKRELEQRHREERAAFSKREEGIAGRLRNTLSAFRSEAEADGQAPAAIGRLFKLAASKEARSEALAARQQSELRALERRRSANEKEAARRVRQILHFRHQQARIEFLARRERLVKAQANERSALRLEWRKRHQERRRDWHDMARRTEPKEKLKADFTRASEGIEAKKERIKRQLRESRERGKNRGKDKPR